MDKRRIGCLAAIKRNQTNGYDYREQVGRYVGYVAVKLLIFNCLYTNDEVKLTT